MIAVVLIGFAVMIFGGGALTWWLLAPQPNTENPDIRNILSSHRSTPHKGAPLAGTAALDTLDRVRDALTKIDRLEDDSWAAWDRDADMFEQGRSDAYGHAHTLITEALGDTP